MRLFALALLSMPAIAAPASAVTAPTDAAVIENTTAPAEPEYEMKRVCIYSDESGSRLGPKTCTIKKVPKKPKGDHSKH